MATDVLYKYMESRFAARMLAHGEIRLGTLYGFRDEERLGPHIGDCGEGTITLRKSGFTILDTGVAGGVPPFLRQSIRATGGSRIEVIARDGVGRREEDPDCWVYCTSEQFDAAQMRRLGYDACVEIFDIEHFFFAISGKLRHRVGRFWGAAKCVYRDREIEHTDYDGIPPAFIKPPRFSSQAEVRAVWFARNGARLQPITVRAKKAVRFCRMYQGGT